MTIIDWVLLGAVILEALMIPVVHFNGFKSGMQVQYEKTKGLPPMVPAATFTKPNINGNGHGNPDPLLGALEDEYYKS